jgi:Zn-finger protein
MICPWCDEDYPVEFFEEHHLNHIHADDRPENKINICVKCHIRHHRESGYDTIILKKSDVTPKTLEEQMAQIDREVFLKVYREYQERVFNTTINRVDKEETINNWLGNGAKTPFVGVKDIGFNWKGK